MSDGITITINAESAKALSNIEGFFGSVTSGLDKLTGASDFLEGLGAKIAAAFTLGAIVEGFKHAVESADEFGRAVEKTGLSIDTLNSLKILARENGVSFQDLTTALEMFNNRIFDAVKLGGEAARPFRELKISLTNAKGEVLSTETVWRQFMDRIAAMPDGIEKTGFAMALLPRVGREMIPILNQTSAGLDRVRNAGGIDARQIAQAREFTTAMSELEDEVENLFRKLTFDALPALKQFVEYLKDGVLAEELGQFSTFFELSMKSAIQDVSNFLSQEIAKWATQIDSTLDKAKQPGFMSKVGSGIVGTGAGLLALGDLAGAKVGIPGAQESADKRVEQANKFFQYAGMADGIMQQAAEAFVQGTKGLPNEYKKALDDFRDKMHKAANSVNQKFGGANTPARSSFFKKAGSPAGATGAGEVDNVAAVSEEGKKLIEEIDKAWREATEGKLALLDHDKADTLKKLKDEFHSAIKNEKVYTEDRLKVEQTFAARRQAILDEQADQASKQSLEALKGRIDLVQRNPDLTDAEKKRELLPLLEQEKKLLQDILVIEQARAADPKRNQEEQGKARDAAARLQLELAELQAEHEKTAQTPFMQVQKELEQQNDLQKEVAGSFRSTFNGAISSVSGNLTAVIMKTESWRQALAKIGDQILSSIIGAIIEMGVRYIATQIMMAVAGKAIAAASLGPLAATAAAQSAILATPAVLASIGSYGEAAIQAPGFIAAAIAETLGSVAAFAEGGLVTGPGTDTSDSILSRLSRGEYVIPAERVRQYGTGFLENLRAGMELADAVPRSLARPITSQADYGQRQDDGETSAAGAQTPGGITVQGHKVTFIQPSNRQEMLDAMASSEGEKIWVKHGQKNKMKIGVGS